MQTDAEEPEASGTDKSVLSDTSDSHSEASAPEQALADETGSDASQETDSTDSTDETPAPEPADAEMQTDSKTPEAPGIDKSDPEAPAPEQALAEEPLETSSEEAMETVPAANAKADEVLTPEPADVAMQIDPETPKVSKADAPNPPVSSNGDPEAPVSEQALADKADSETGETASHAPVFALFWKPLQINRVTPTPISTAFKVASTSEAYPPALSKEAVQTSYAAPNSTSTVVNATSTSNTYIPALSKEAVQTSYGAPNSTSTFFKATSTSNAYMPALSKEAVQTSYGAPNSTSTVFMATSTSNAYMPALSKEAVQTSYAAPKATSTVSQTTSSAPCSTASGGIEKAEVDAYLKGHNDIRAQHGASPLMWATDLAMAAAKRAENCVWDNSKGQVGAFGENQAAGTNMGAAAAVKMWTDEASKYNPADPNCSSHFTQVVWKATTEVGCAVKTCNNILPNQPGAANFHVCEYREPGNVSGKFAENVQV
ncbi:cysteine-rich secretory family protein [Rhizoctonia solani AG-3 Rhs1AP]|nr:cysteine-rich secretory family protein [Rhizoctonia solani AG-3 Rhs1AP]